MQRTLPIIRASFSVNAFTLGVALLFGSSCSSSVNVLYRKDTDAGPAPIVTSVQTCPPLANAPAGVVPLPSAPQLAHQRTELTAFLHFGLNTFDGTEYGDSSQDTPAIFNPTNLDATEWANALKEAGIRDAMLVVKHTTGFCLWPSAYTDYSVKNSPWKNGQGDVVRDFVDAMRAAGMRMGFYLSPADNYFPDSNPEYITYFKNQVSELLTNYGPVHEIYLSGDRSLAALDWKSVAALAKELQPNVLVWMGPELATTGADLRYVGNQSARSSRTTSSIADVPNGGPSNVWYPVDAPFSDRGSSWFWHPDGTVVTLDALKSAYFSSVGMNTSLILNVPPSTTGQFDAPDLDLLRQFGAWHSALFKSNLLRGQAITADSTWASSGFDAAKATDDDICTYWAAADGATTARLEVTLPAPAMVQLISIREAIELGERSTGYHVEFKQNGAWNTSPTDASGARIQGTVIGERQLWQLNATSIEAVALVIDSARAAPAIAEFGAY
jgi:alpha-L-fucosidase